MIDVKELRIGAHYYNTSYTKPVIGRIMSIYGKDRVTLCYDIPLDPETDPYEGAMLNYLEPVPLTAELLQEIGFAYIEHWSKSVYLKDNIQVCFKNKYIVAGVVDADYRAHTLPVRYLHELEAIVYLTTKQELIKEG